MPCFYYFHAPSVWEALFSLPEPSCLQGAGATDGSVGAGWAMALTGRAPDAGPPTVTPLQMKIKSLSSGQVLLPPGVTVCLFGLQINRSPAIRRMV